VIAAGPSPNRPAFFLNLRGDRLTEPEFNHYFAKLIGQVGLGCMRKSVSGRCRGRSSEILTSSILPSRNISYEGSNAGRAVPG
jgi:hypothetical protein